MLPKKHSNDHKLNNKKFKNRLSSIAIYPESFQYDIKSRHGNVKSRIKFNRFIRTDSVSLIETGKKIMITLG